jgi:hypothetical protein
MKPDAFVMKLIHLCILIFAELQILSIFGSKSSPQAMLKDFAIIKSKYM